MAGRQQAYDVIPISGLKPNKLVDFSVSIEKFQTEVYPESCQNGRKALDLLDGLQRLANYVTDQTLAVRSSPKGDLHAKETQVQVIVHAKRDDKQLVEPSFPGKVEAVPVQAFNSTTDERLKFGPNSADTLPNNAAEGVDGIGSDTSPVSSDDEEKTDGGPVSANMSDNLSASVNNFLASTLNEQLMVFVQLALPACAQLLDLEHYFTQQKPSVRGLETLVNQLKYLRSEEEAEKSSQVQRYSDALDRREERTRFRMPHLTLASDEEILSSRPALVKELEGKMPHERDDILLRAKLKSEYEQRRQSSALLKQRKDEKNVLEAVSERTNAAVRSTEVKLTRMKNYFEDVIVRVNDTLADEPTAASAPPFPDVRNVMKLWKGAELSEPQTATSSNNVTRPETETDTVDSAAPESKATDAEFSALPRFNFTSMDELSHRIFARVAEMEQEKRSPAATVDASRVNRNGLNQQTGAVTSTPVSTITTGSQSTALDADKFVAPANPRKRSASPARPNGSVPNDADGPGRKKLATPTNVSAAPVAGLNFPAVNGIKSLNALRSTSPAVTVAGTVDTDMLSIKRRDVGATPAAPTTNSLNLPNGKLFAVPTDRLPSLLSGGSSPRLLPLAHSEPEEGEISD